MDFGLSHCFVVDVDFCCWVFELYVDVGSVADVSEVLSPYSGSKMEGVFIRKNEQHCPRPQAGAKRTSKWDEMQELRGDLVLSMKASFGASGGLCRK
jgi:hypothetical protein